MNFRGIQKTLTYTQNNTANIEKVFPLLCPVREIDWLDGWQYKIIHSVSGLIEKDCVFTTPYQGELETTWHVTRYNAKKFYIEFLRITPNENVVKINIQLLPIDEGTTSTIISYQYTALNQEQNKFIDTELESNFTNSMKWWEKAINHYLATGEKLLKP